MCRTGDLGRWRADGRIELLGRIDQQVKIGGYRIEVGEIEAVLDEHPAVRKSVVVAQDDGASEKRLIGYVVLAAEAAVQPAELQRHAQAQLPAFMVPSEIVKLTELPLLPNGKVNRKALPLVGQTSDGANGDGADYVAPVGKTEQLIASLWQEALGLARVSVEENFFDVGGHSLLMIQVQRKLQEATGSELSTVDMFMYPTVRSLAAHLEQLQDDGAATAAASEDIVAQRAQNQSAAMKRRRDLMKDLKRDE
jgi:hypothetical protein